MLCALIMIFKYIVYLNLGIKYIIKYYVLLITYVSKRITIFDYTYSTDLTFSEIETLKLVLVRSKFRKEKRRKKGGNFRRLLVKFSFPLGIIEREKLLMSFCFLGGFLLQTSLLAGPPSTNKGIFIEAVPIGN